MRLAAIKHGCPKPGGQPTTRTRKDRNICRSNGRKVGRKSLLAVEEP